MSNLFSSFDPSSIFSCSLNWGSSILFLVLFPASPLFLVNSRRTQLFRLIASLLNYEFKAILGAKVKPGRIWFLLAIFFFVFVNNFLGLFPFIFTRSSHLRFALSIALPLWIGHIILSWVKQPIFALAHLVPKGTPRALMRFIVIIELVRNVIRPLTLSVRLMANMTAGHLLLCLLRSNVSIRRMSSSILVLSALVVLVILEIAVSLIQAYVFTLLSTLYLEEVQTKALLAA